MALLEKDQFFEVMDAQGLALTYDDVRMRTRAGQDAPLDEIDISSSFSQNVELKVPFVSAAMDTVTDGDMAIAMAKLGGIGVIHGAMSPEDQHKEIRRVKKEVNGIIEEPITVLESDTLASVLEMCADRQFDFRTFPVRSAEGSFVGLLSNDGFKYAQDHSVETVGEVMKPREEVVSAEKGTSLAEAYQIMHDNKINTLPILSEERGDEVLGLYIYSDVDRIQHDVGQYNVDDQGRLRTAAAVSTGKNVLERMNVIKKYLDVVVIDTADGDSYYAFETLKAIKGTFPELDVVVGNISDGESALLLAKAGADGIKVGQGPGSICTTRRETGIGMPQVTALYDSMRALGEEYAHIPICADGGIKEHGDIPIAFAAGARSVMMGRMLAGTEEAPGKVIKAPGGGRVKVYRGMGSLSALQDNAASRERYGVNGKGIILAEGVESQIPFDGKVSDVVGLCMAALEKGMRYVKAPDIEYHREHTRFIQITNAGLRESHPHDVAVITR